MKPAPGLHHELSSCGSLLFASSSSGFGFVGGLGVIKYAYVF